MYAAGYLDYSQPGRAVRPAARARPDPGDRAGTGILRGRARGAAGRRPGVPHVLEAFRTGRGLSADQLHPDVAEGTSRFTAQWHTRTCSSRSGCRGSRTSRPARAGAHVADVGCGSGLAVITLAAIPPESTFVGYDISPDSRRTGAPQRKDAGVGDAVRFEVLDASAGLPEHFDVITTFDVVHDAVDPQGLLAPSATGCARTAATCASTSTARTRSPRTSARSPLSCTGSASCTA